MSISAWSHTAGAGPAAACSETRAKNWRWRARTASPTSCFEAKWW
ncbi:hypothetical protein ABTY35_24565 [Streptomyces fimicarius]|nr:MULTISPECIES: hypothetical protein [Streptomyces]MCX4713982.1 hypothetical protein [Streptomyces griseus]